MKAPLLLACLLVILKVFGQDKAYFEEKADLKMKEGDFKYAMVFIDKAIEVDKNDVWLRLKKAEIAFKLEGPGRSIEIVMDAMKIDMKNAETYNRAGSYFDSAGKIDSAIIMYNRAIDLAKNDTIAYSFILNRGAAKVGHQDFEGARSDFESILEFDPDNIAALNNIAPVYRQLDMKEKAIECLQKVISIDSTMLGPYVNLGFVYSKLDSLDLSIFYFNKALTLDPNEPLIFSNRGHVYYKMKEYGKALADINKSINIYPTNSYAYRNLALIYLDTDKLQEACTALGYADYYGFTQRYGNEVAELIEKHCK